MSVQSRNVILSSPFSSFIEFIPKNWFLLLGLKGFNNFGCSVKREFFLSEIIFKWSFVLFGRSKKSSGNIFLEELL